jgi:hypothetical protein
VFLLHSIKRIFEMSLIKLGLFGAAGYGLYKYLSGRGSEQHAAFAHDEVAPGNSTQVRNAGVDAMRDTPPRWNKTDDTLDQSFPASDPPSTY